MFHWKQFSTVTKIGYREKNLLKQFLLKNCSTIKKIVSLRKAMFILKEKVISTKLNFSTERKRFFY